jgi:aminoglycoside phosphotransferase (APT) family kinase protein
MPLTEKPIAFGRTAELFAWGTGRVLKLLRPGFAPGLIQQEEAITRAMLQAGLPAPKIYEVLEVDGRPGIVYERIDGPALIERMQQRPLQLRQHAAQLARLHAAVHTHRYSPAPADAPRQKPVLVQQIEQAEVLPAAQRAAALALLERLPDGDTLCHNDFHPLNVLLGANGALIIDWESANLGNPCADVARTSLTVALAWPAEGFPNRLAQTVAVCYLRAFSAAYLSSYRALTHDRLPDLRAWQTVQAAAKVQWEPPANQARWMRVIEQGLEIR